MKRFITGVFAVACAAALSVSLAACGGSSSASSASASASASASSASASASAAASSSAVAADEYIDPADIHPGWLDSDIRTSDVWYLDGDTSAEGIYFTYANNEAGLSFTRVDANNEDGDGEFNLIITEDKHLRTAGGTAPKIDIVFDDEMNCYDYVSGNFYSRGDLKALTAMVSGKTFADVDRDIEMTFFEDGTYSETVRGESENGTWKVAAATVVEMTYDSDGYVEEYRLTIDGDKITQIMDSGWKYYDLKA